MKAYVILINWMLSFFMLSIDTEKSAIWMVALVVVYFVFSSLVLVWADSKGMFRRFKSDGL